MSHYYHHLIFKFKTQDIVLPYHYVYEIKEAIRKYEFIFENLNSYFL